MVRDQWEGEGKLRRLQDPAPLPVRWVNADSLLIDHWANIHGDRSGLAPLDLSGWLDDIVDVFKRVPSQRLVVLGKPGAGKTVLGLQFTLDVLARRQPGQPVPTIFSLASWNPFEQNLPDWMAEQLAATYLGGVTSSRITLARQLVDAHRLLPVLDGFDEIAERLRPEAIRALNTTFGRGDQFLLTSRADEYAAAVDAADVVTAAAVVELQPLHLGDLDDYLPRTTRKTMADSKVTTKWNPVLTCLRTHPDRPTVQALMKVLATPLMTSLARAAYSDTDADPTELLDDRFTDPAVIEDYLLDAFIPAVFPEHPTERSVRHHRWKASQVQRWLAFLAVHLNALDTKDLAWWRLEQTAPRRTLGLMSGIMVSLVLGAVVGLVDGVMVGLQYGIVFGLGAVFGAVFGAGRGAVFLFGLMLGLVAGFGAGLVLGAVVGIVFGLLFGLGAGLASVPAMGRPSTVGFQLRGNVGPYLHALKTGLVFGLVFGSVAVLMVGVEVGLVVGLVVGLDIPADIAYAVSPSSVLRTDRASALVRGLVAALVAGLPEGLGAGIKAGLEVGLAAGLIVGLIVGLVVMSSSAWARFILVRTWLAFRRRLPWRLMTFLVEAHRRGVLRQAGGVYQFRHHRLQQRLMVDPVMVAAVGGAS